MKKSFFIIPAIVIALSIMAFGYLKEGTPEKNLTGTQSNPLAILDDGFITSFNGEKEFEVLYHVDHRFFSTITREDLHQAKTIIDILPREGTQSKVSYQNVEVSVLDVKGETTEMGENENLNTAQLELLQSIDYSVNLRITASCQRKNAVTGKLMRDTVAYHMTVVPKRSALFSKGKWGLIEYLKENSKEEAAMIQKDKLQPGKVGFTVSKEGVIEGVRLISTSGYPTVDEALLELVNSIPNEWEPATDAQGKKVDQELVFFFGSAGC